MIALRGCYEILHTFDEYLQMMERVKGGVVMQQRAHNVYV